MLLEKREEGDFSGLATSSEQVPHIVRKAFSLLGFLKKIIDFVTINNWKSYFDFDYTDRLNILFGPIFCARLLYCSFILWQKYIKSIKK